MDPTGCFTILGLLIGIGLSLVFEVVEDALDGNGMDHDWKDYLGAGISGTFGALGGNMLMRGAFAVAVGLADSWSSGDLQENGLGSTLLSIGTSFVVGELASGLSNFISNKIQIGKLTSNAHTNRDMLKKLGMKYSLNKNGKSTEAFVKAIKTNTWASKMISAYTSSSISSNTLSIVLGSF